LGRVAAQEPHQAEFESRWEAAPAVAVLIGLQVGVAVVSRLRHWQLWTLPWWVWLVPVAFETPLVLVLSLGGPRRYLERLGHRRGVAFALFGVVSFANAVQLIALIGSILTDHETSGTALLLKGVVIWTTNVICFGLWFWGLDRGGPVVRHRAKPPPPDFQFPQMENPQLAESGWHPRLTDYLYVSFTNSIAFSPTDAMPLTRWAKLLMLLEAATSGVAVLLVTARAVNILR
jgi:hypothetical protein